MSKITWVVCFGGRVIDRERLQTFVVAVIT